MTIRLGPARKSMDMPRHGERVQPGAVYIIDQFRGVGVCGAVHGNNCRGLLIALGEADASALWPCRLSQGAREQAIEISAFSCSCRGSTAHPHPTELSFL